MDFETVKDFMKQAGWGFLATSDGNKVGVRPMGSCVWIDNELWCASRDKTDKVAQLRKVPYAEYCVSTREGTHVRIAGPCTISTTLKRYYKDPLSPEYVVIRMKPERIRIMAQTGKGYEDVKITG
jgi:general stress protein 26